MAWIETCWNPVKTDNKILDRLIILVIIAVPSSITIIFTVLYKSSTNNDVMMIFLAVDYILAELINIILMSSYLYLSKHPHEKITDENIFCMILYATIWYLVNTISVIICQNGIPIWISIIGISPVLTMLPLIIIYTVVTCCVTKT